MTLLSSDTMYRSIPFSQANVPSPFFNGNLFIESQNKPNYSFLLNHLKGVSFSLGKKSSFSFEELLSRNEIREKAFSKIQKVLKKKIYNLSKEILEELYETSEQLNLKTAQKILNLELWSAFLKIFKEFNKIRNIDIKTLNDFQSLLSFTAKASNFYSKLTRGEIHFDPTEFLERYHSLHTCITTSFEFISSMKEVSSLLQNNTFIKIGYETLWQEEMPISGIFTHVITLHDALTPFRWAFKSRKLIKYCQRWVELGEQRPKCKSDQIIIDQEISKIQGRIFKKSIDLTRETIKLSAWACVKIGMVSSTPYTVSFLLACLSLRCLAKKIHKIWKKAKKAHPSI